MIASNGRILCDIAHSTAGPLLIAVAAVHGNEPSGVRAIEGFSSLFRETKGVQGRFVGIVGNKRALEAQRRFIDIDLNRAWTTETIERVLNRNLQFVEEYELVEVKAVLDDLLSQYAADEAPCFLIDLHSTSSESFPFIASAVAPVGSTAVLQQVVQSLAVPRLTFSTDPVRGSLSTYYGSDHCPTCVFEAGNHSAQASVRAAEDALWSVAASIGLVSYKASEVQTARQRLSEATGDVPREVELYYRHAISPEDNFRMRPGYRNFQRVSCGEVIADDRSGPIAVPEDAYLIFPLYQPQGEDGFFLAR